MPITFRIAFVLSTVALCALTVHLLQTAQAERSEYPWIVNVPVLTLTLLFATQIQTLRARVRGVPVWMPITAVFATVYAGTFAPWGLYSAMIVYGLIGIEWIRIGGGAPAPAPALDPNAPIRESLVGYREQLRKSLAHMPPEERAKAKLMIKALNEEERRRQPVKATQGSVMEEAGNYLSSLRAEAEGRPAPSAPSFVRPPTVPNQEGA